MKKIVTLVLILSLSPVFALHTIVNITPDNFIATYDDARTSIVINETLYFLDSDFKLWKSMGDVTTTAKVSINGADVKVAFDGNSLIKHGDKLLFINNTDNNTIWESDGINFQKLSDLEIDGGVFARLYKRNNKVYALVDNQLLAIDEGSNASLITIDNLEYLKINSLCVFDDDHFSFYGREIDGSNKYFTYNNSSLTEITSDTVDFSTVNYSLYHKDSCLLKSTTDDLNSGNHNGYFNLKQNGDLELISNLVNNNQTVLAWDEAFIFNEKLYFFRSSGLSGDFLYELIENNTQPEASVIGSCRTCFNTSISSTKDFLIFDTSIFTNVIGQTEKRTTFIFDKQLNLITSLAENEFSPQITSLDNQPILLYKEDINRLLITDSGLLTATILTPSISLTNVIGGGDSVFLFGKNRENENKLALYKISNRQAISNQLDGLWVNEDYKSQGLSIHTGVRPDGSQYIFVSFYIYRNGLPLWVAGNANYTNGQSVASFELSEYEGSSFIPNDIGLEDLKISFGSVTLIPTGCNEVDIDISLDNEQALLLPMNRITSNNKEDMCVD